MYKTAIARIEGKSSYDEALNSFRASYPAYEVRGLKQSNNGWIAFIQKSAFEEEEVSEDIPMLEEDEDVSPGADEEVGKLADLMATKADGMAKNYVPESPSVLSATPLVNPGGRSELSFNAPKVPGRYAFLCTFPGHWRIMRGDLVVE